MKILLFFSLFSMAASLIAIVYSSMNLLSDISGLKTSSEKLVYISSLLKGHLESGSENLIIQSRRDIDFCIQSLEDVNPEVRAVAAEAPVSRQQ